MAEYVAPLTKLESNIIYGGDGSVWSNFILLGVNVHRYDDSRIEGAQSSNAELFSALSRIESPEFILAGFKAQDDPKKILDAAATGLPGINDDEYADLLSTFQGLHDRMVSGEFAQYRRVYWLSVAHPYSLSMLSKAVRKVAVTDPHEGISHSKVADFDKKIFRTIPEAFMPRRTTPDHVRWAFDRARLRGVEAPFEPGAPVPGQPYVPPNTANLRFSTKSFAQVLVNQAADSDSFYQRYVNDVSERLIEHAFKAGVPQFDPTGKDAAALYRKFVKDVSEKINTDAAKGFGASSKESLLSNFRTLRKGKVLSIANPDSRNADFPDGFVSYQSCMALAAAPPHDSEEINAVTHVVDTAIGLDGDFTIRFSYSKAVTDRATTSKALRDLKSEDAANSRDELDADDYADEIGDVYDLHDTVRADPNPIGMKVTIYFAFGHCDLDEAINGGATMVEHFASNGFTAYQPVGGQEEIFKQMMPGVTKSPLTDDLALTTTANLLGAMIPVRRSFVGDTQGVPVAVNQEDALGQIVLLDLLESTDKGNASQVITGAQGSGKSHWIKLLLGYMIDLKKHVYLIDQHAHGEYTVFASTLRPDDTLIFDVTGQEYSLDPLKLYPSGGPAEKIFLDLWLPLLKISETDAMATTLSNMLKWEFRQQRRIFSTRSLIEYLIGEDNPASPELVELFMFWGAQDYCSALIDPMERSRIKPLPPLPDDRKCVVFRTHNLSVYTGDNIAEVEPAERYSAVLYTAIAHVAAYRFSKIKDTCAFFGDEMHFLDGNDRVLKRLIGAQDRTARKDRNFVVAGSQLAKDFGAQYDMVSKRWAMRQETKANAIDSLDWIELPVTEYMCHWMTSETSPRDEHRNNMPKKGREGEGWFNDGFGNTARIKVLPHMRADRARMSDTTSSRMIRSSELETGPQVEV